MGEQTMDKPGTQFTFAVLICLIGAIAAADQLESVVTKFGNAHSVNRVNCPKRSLLVSPLQRSLPSTATPLNMKMFVRCLQALITA